jgi:hypothetical protein
MKEISSMDFPQHGEVFYFYDQVLQRLLGQMMIKIVKKFEVHAVYTFLALWASHLRFFFRCLVEKIYVTQAVVCFCLAELCLNSEAQHHFFTKNIRLPVH